MQTADFYSSATGTLRVNGGRDENAPQGVSLSIDDLSYIKQGSRATDSSNTGTTDYNELVNKPKINSITLTGNVLLSDIGAQPAIDSSHKVSADNIDDTSTTNKFATVAELEQIETNKNNISSLQSTVVSYTDVVIDLHDDVTWAQGVQGIYYSTTVTVPNMNTIYAVSITSLSSIPNNSGLIPRIDETTKIGLYADTGTWETSQRVTIRVVGIEFT